MDIPKGSNAAELVYKSGFKDLELTFLPPLNSIYEYAPVYFIIPGGGWHTETRQSMLDFSAISVRTLREAGFAAVSIDYRVCGDGAVMRDIITDCFDAARYIAHFADVLKIDKNKFVLSGHSAGAQLALMLAYAPGDAFKDGYTYDDAFGVMCVAALSAPAVLYDNSTNNLRDIGNVFGADDSDDARRLASPVTYVSPKCPRTLLCAGTSDYLVFATSSEILHEKLTQCGADSRLVLSTGGGHCFEKINSGIEPGISSDRMQNIVSDFVLENIR